MQAQVVGLHWNRWDELLIKADPNPQAVGMEGEEAVVIPTAATEPATAAIKCQAGYEDEIPAAGRGRGSGRRLKDAEGSRDKIAHRGDLAHG